MTVKMSWEMQLSTNSAKSFWRTDRRCAVYMFKSGSCEKHYLIIKCWKSNPQADSEKKGRVDLELLDARPGGARSI